MEPSCINPQLFIVFQTADHQGFSISMAFSTLRIRLRYSRLDIIVAISRELSDLHRSGPTGSLKESGFIEECSAAQHADHCVAPGPSRLGLGEPRVHSQRRPQGNRLHTKEKWWVGSDRGGGLDSKVRREWQQLPVHFKAGATSGSYVIALG